MYREGGNKTIDKTFALCFLLSSKAFNGLETAYTYEAQYFPLCNDSNNWINSLVFNYSYVH